MIITKFIEIKLHNSTIKFYRNLGYTEKSGEKITIPIEHLSKGSDYIIEAECDKCYIIKRMTYGTYNRNISNQGSYVCCDCCQEKKDNTNMKNRGVKSPLQDPIIMQKIRNTCTEIYGVDNPAKNENVKNKIKATNNRKYGKDYPLQSIEIMQKVKDTNREV